MLTPWRYHWSVEYFEDLRNVNHCEFVLMKLNQDSGKYILQSELRTWSEYKRLKQVEEAKRNPSRRNTLSAFLSQPLPTEPEKSPSITGQHWGGCPAGCNHAEHNHAPNSIDESKLPPPAAEAGQPAKNENDDHALGPHEPASPARIDGTTEDATRRPATSIPPHLLSRGVTTSGSETPHEMPSDDESEAFPFPDSQVSDERPVNPSRSMANAMRRMPQRQPTPDDIERWAHESGMGSGKQADALGDEPEAEGDVLSSDPDGQSQELKGLAEAERKDKSLRGSVY